MAIETPTNCWTQAEQSLVDALPQLAAFRSLVEAANDAAAAPFIFVDELKKPVNGEAFTLEEQKALKHYAVVYSASDKPYGIRRISDVPGDLFEPFGVLQLYVERLIPEAEEAGEDTAENSKRYSDRWFKNRLGDLLQQLVDYWAQNSGPMAQQATVVDGPFHNSPEERETSGHWQGAEISIPWGQSED